MHSVTARTTNVIVPPTWDQHLESRLTETDAVDKHISRVLTQSKDLLAIYSRVHSHLSSTSERRVVGVGMQEEIRQLQSIIDCQARKAQGAIASLLGEEAPEAFPEHVRDVIEDGGTWETYAEAGSTDAHDNTIEPMDESWACLAKRTVRVVARMVKTLPDERHRGE